MGQAGLADFKRDMTPSIEVVPDAGYVISPAFHGLGYATEAMQAVMGWADDVLKAPLTCAIIQDENTASIRVAEKLGFGRAETADLSGTPVTLYWRDRPAAP